jgi:uncharacterized membrane protein required for colicin V production
VTSAGDAATAVRRSHWGWYAAIRLGYRTVDDLANWLEAHADEAQAQEVAAAAMLDIGRCAVWATHRMRARRFVREIAEAVRRYRSAGRLT